MLSPISICVSLFKDKDKQNIYSLCITSGLRRVAPDSYVLFLFLIRFIVVSECSVLLCFEVI